MSQKYAKPNKQTKNPDPTIPMVKNFLKSIESPMCPDKNIPIEYAAKNETSIDPNKEFPSGPLNGSHPSLPNSLCVESGFKTDFTIDGGFLVAWYIV